MVSVMHCASLNGTRVMYLFCYFALQLVITLCAHPNEGYFTVQQGYSVTTVYSSTTARTLLQCSNACRTQNDVTPGTCLAATYDPTTRQCSFSSQSATIVNPATKTVILAKVCGLPPLVTNANLVVTSATPSGSTATVSCQGGLVATPTTVQCLPGSGWSNYGFDCVPTPPPPPPSVNCIGSCTNDVNGFRLCDGGGVGVCNPMQGRLEVFYNNVWGTVCDDYWLDGETWAIPNANVACRTFGYSSGVNKPMAFFGEGVGDIWLDDITCAGTEQFLLDCPHYPWGSHNCMHHEDTGVVCSI